MNESTRLPINLVVLGAPGAGKGTQAVQFARRHGILRISTGDILRDAVQAKTALGQRAKVIIDAGALVDDQLMIAIVRERLARADGVGGFVLDGFPRNVLQATALDEIMAGNGALIVVNIDVPEDALVERLGQRRVCVRCGNAASIAIGGAVSRCKKCGGELVLRSDDAESVVRERLRVYAEVTRPLVDYYSSRSTFRTIDGNQSQMVVAVALRAAVDGVLADMSAVDPVSEGATG